MDALPRFPACWFFLSCLQFCHFTFLHPLPHHRTHTSQDMTPGAFRRCQHGSSLRSPFSTPILSVFASTCKASPPSLVLSFFNTPANTAPPVVLLVRSSLPRMVGTESWLCLFPPSLISSQQANSAPSSPKATLSLQSSHPLLQSEAKVSLETAPVYWVRGLKDSSGRGSSSQVTKF